MNNRVYIDYAIHIFISLGCNLTDIMFNIHAVNYHLGF